MEQYYKTIPPGLKRRLAYSKLLKHRELMRLEIYMTYEERANLIPVYVGVSSMELVLNTSISLGFKGDFCSICQEDFSLMSLARILKCSHKFHHKCLSNYCKFYNRCPLCRKDII